MLSSLLPCPRASAAVHVSSSVLCCRPPEKLGKGVDDTDVVRDETSPLHASGASSRAVRGRKKPVGSAAGVATVEKGSGAWSYPGAASHQVKQQCREGALTRPRHHSVAQLSSSPSAMCVWPCGPDYCRLLLINQLSVCVTTSNALCRRLQRATRPQSHRANHVRGCHDTTMPQKTLVIWG